MDRLRTTLVTAFVIALVFAPAASGQATAAKVEVVSGNGQLVCPICPLNPSVLTFHPMVVKVSDANGHPISGKTVNWALVSVGQSPQLPVFNLETTTDNNGLSVNPLFQSSLLTGSFLTPFLQSVISASADDATVSFTETMALADINGSQIIQVTPGWLPNPPPVLSGPAGTTGTTPFKIRVFAGGTAVPHVSVRIMSPEVSTSAGLVINDPNRPTASCLTGPGADPGSVLTDASGIATCYPVFGPGVGTGYVSALVGALDPNEFDQSIVPEGTGLNSPIAYAQYTGLQLSVAAVVPGLVTVVSGNNQQVDPGHASDPLVVQVTDVTGAVPVVNQNVTFTVVSGSATLSPVTAKTDSAGHAQTIVTLSGSAIGPITVKAALTGNLSGISTTFALSPLILISSLIKVSGDLQTTQAGQKFPADLIVQVIGTNGLALSNQPISFQVTSGTATLSTPLPTDTTGQAHVTVTAGSTPGNVTVNAFIGTFSQSFTLTVIPPGPVLSSSSFFNAGGLTRIGALSPCGLVTVFASGLAPNAQGMVFNTNYFGPWATSLASDTVTVASVAAPIFSVGNVGGAEQLTFQVPCETAPADSVPITVGVAGGTSTIGFPVVAASPGIFETVMSDGVRRAVAVRPDGTFVSLQNPARRGETIRVFVTGLGPTSPLMVTGSVPVPGVDSLAAGDVIVGVNNSGVGPSTARVSPNLIGVYEVSFLVPSDAPAANDVVLSVAVNAIGDTQTRFSNGSKLPIQ